MMATNPLAPDPLTDIDGPPLIRTRLQRAGPRPDIDPIRDPDSGKLPQDEPGDEEPEEDPDDEPLAYEDELVEPIVESDIEIDDAIFGEHRAKAGTIG
jgi:hypothetical protein